MKLSPEQKRLVREMGKAGGHARKKSLTPERLTEIAKAAVQAREKKRKQKRLK